MNNSVAEVLDNYDWEEAFQYADGTKRIPETVFPGMDTSTRPFGRWDVVHIEAMEEGENDGEDWIIYGRLRDGRWFYLEAWCDYTGWGCQEGGIAKVADTKELIERFGMGKEPRRRFGIVLPEERVR